MKLKIRQRFIEDENGAPLGVLSLDIPEEVERTIEFGSEAIPKVKAFLERMDSGKPMLKATYNEFKALIEKYEV